MAGQLFTGIVHPALGPDFLAERLSSDVAFVDVGAPAVADLLTWDALSEILSTRPLGPPRLRLHSKGKPVPVERYTSTGDSSGVSTRLVRPDAFYRELRDGASLVLDAVDRLHPPVRAAADDLMLLVRERVQVNLYVIWGDSHGFDTHWDDHDTFVVQLAGSKSWTVHGQGSRRHPLRVDSDHAHTAPSEVVWEGVLRPGHVLHVPRGWWHTVTGTGDASMHLTFGFAPATGVDWAGRLVELLHESEVFRRDLPRFADAEGRRAWHRELLRELAALAEGHDLDAFLRDRDDRFPRRQTFALPWAVDDAPLPPDAVVVATPILPPTVTGPDGESGSVTLTVSGRAYRLPAVAAPVLAALLDAGRLRMADLAERSGQEPATVAGVVRALLRHHLVTVEPATPSEPAG